MRITAGLRQPCLDRRSPAALRSRGDEEIPDYRNRKRLTGFSLFRTFDARTYVEPALLDALFALLCAERERVVYAQQNFDYRGYGAGRIRGV
jgi:hypothetical protein